MSRSSPSSASGSKLRVRAPAKINLHLEVLGLRNDDFHELAMVMQTIDLADYLEIQINSKGSISLTTDTPELETGEQNLIIKAAKLLRSQSGISDLGATIHLEKNIPIGAGLAGGSSDAAATLFALNRFWNLAFTKKQLIELASELGSDVAFCLEGGSQMCFGRGEKLEALECSNERMSVILVKDPSVSISTPWAYQRCKDVCGSSYLKTEADFEKRRQLLRFQKWVNPLTPSTPPPLQNDLQKIVADARPEVKNALSLLARLPGSIGVAMSGSGPSCFALYPNFEEANLALEQSRNKLKEEGLDSWCCSFSSEGVTIA